MPSPLTVREVLRLLRRDGWILERQRGTSHRQFKHPSKAGKVTVAGKEGVELDPGTLRSIFQQAGLPWPPPPKMAKGKRKKQK